jgi:hypothetical protein
MYRVLQMHEVQNLALHIRKPLTRILKLSIFCNKENLPQLMESFLGQGVLLENGLFGIP